MNATASTTLAQLALDRGLAVERLGHANALKLTRDGVAVTVTVPDTVLEWFVDATDVESNLQVQDWFDYEGYDSSPRATLEDEMATDVREFVNAVLDRALRVVVTGRKPVLEWRCDGKWLAAIPVRHP